jgi:hypothetical protein
MSLFTWLRNPTANRACRGGAQYRVAARFRPQLEALEDRCLPSTLTVTSIKDNGPGSLRAEIAAAKNNDMIVFSPKLDGKTITLAGSELDITKNLTIQGPGADQLTIIGGGNSRVFEVAPNTTVTLSGLTISNGLGVAANHFVNPNNPLDGYGGGILNQGTLTVSGCTLSDNFTNYGGGIYNTGTLTVTGCTVSGNHAEYRGGGILNDGTLTVTGSLFSNNSPDNIFGPYTGGGDTFS